MCCWVKIYKPDGNEKKLSTYGYKRSNGCKIM